MTILLRIAIDFPIGIACTTYIKIFGNHINLVMLVTLLILPDHISKSLYEGELCNVSFISTQSHHQINLPIHNRDEPMGD
jgi:hypothetical protein